MGEQHFGPVWFIEGLNKGRYPYCHSVYIEGAGILIDPASDRKRLLALKQNHGVKAVLLSHAHEDHFRDIDLFDDVPVWLSPAEAGPLSSIEKLLDSYGAFGEMRDYFRKILEDQFHFTPREPDRFVRDGEIIDAGDVTIEVIHTPGHTPGHLSFLFSEPRTLFLGDYDLTPFGPWYGDAQSSIENTIDSILHLKSIPAEKWISGHEFGVIEQAPDTLWQNYLDTIRIREEKLLDALKEPLTMEGIARSWILYKKPMKPEVFYLFNERVLMEKHLVRLIQKGWVGQDQDHFVRL